MLNSCFVRKAGAGKVVFMAKQTDLVLNMARNMHVILCHFRQRNVLCNPMGLEDSILLFVDKDFIFSFFNLMLFCIGLGLSNLVNVHSQIS